MLNLTELRRIWLSIIELLANCALHVSVLRDLAIKGLSLFSTVGWIFLSSVFKWSFPPYFIAVRGVHLCFTCAVLKRSHSQVWWHMPVAWRLRRDDPKLDPILGDLVHTVTTLEKIEGLGT